MREAREREGGSLRRIRQPIVAVLGHVDHGKTTLLDKIRGTAVAQREAGGITQHIGATEIPIDVVKKICGPLLKMLKVNLRIPGLLFIDTPGHEAFTNLRRRGGAIADIAVLVIDINQGVQPQTVESIEILKTYRTPFLVAANKIDMIPGWKPNEGKPFLETIQKQSDLVRTRLEERLYRIVGQLYELGFESERFDRVSDFRKTVAIVPVSAKTGEGIPELLMIIAGLAQQFLEEQLRIEVSGPGRGTILEVKEERGLGTTIDVILYDGTIRRGDTIVVGGIDGPITTKVRALLKPMPLDEMRDPRKKFKPVGEVSAAAGVKISAPGLEKALAGAPVVVVENGNVEKALDEVRREIGEIRIDTGKTGLIVKADTLGTLEALVRMLTERKKIPVRRADIGDVSRKDVVDAQVVANEDPYLGVILAFNVKVPEEVRELAKNSGVKIFEGNVIYKLIEDYEEWVKKRKEEELKKKLMELVHPAKIRVLPGFVFRYSKPAIFGIEVLGGTLRPGYQLIREDGTVVGRIREIQIRGQNVYEVVRGDQAAISVDGAVFGRHIKENDILYSNIPEEHVKEFKNLSRKFGQVLREDEREVLEEFLRIKRRQNPLWGV